MMMTTSMATAPMPSTGVPMPANEVFMAAIEMPMSTIEVPIPAYVALIYIK